MLRFAAEIPRMMLPFADVVLCSMCAEPAMQHLSWHCAAVVYDLLGRQCVHWRSARLMEQVDTGVFAAEATAIFVTRKHDAS